MHIIDLLYELTQKSRLEIQFFKFRKSEIQLYIYIYI